MRLLFSQLRSVNRQYNIDLMQVWLPSKQTTNSLSTYMTYLAVAFTTLNLPPPPLLLYLMLVSCGRSICLMPGSSLSSLRRPGQWSICGHHQDKKPHRSASQINGVSAGWVLLVVFYNEPRRQPPSSIKLQSNIIPVRVRTACSSEIWCANPDLLDLMLTHNFADYEPDSEPNGEWN